jgi:diguanylate cyclase (GGDEF)-like protein/PAS domain S-box-containing protein
VTATVRGKLAGAITLVIGAIAVLICLTFPVRLEHQALRALAGKAESISEMTAFSVSPALLFSDSRGVRDAIQGALRNADLAYLVVANDSGRVVDAMDRTGSRMPLTATERSVRGVSADKRVYRTVQPIEANGHQVGTLYLGLFLTEVADEVSAARRATAIGGAILLVLGTAAAWGIGTLVSRPLRDMVGVAERIAAGDLSQRARASSKDEVAQLAGAFNLMVTRLGTAQEELAEINRSLESRVAQRTAQLRSSEVRFRGVVDSLAEGVIVVGRNDVIEHVNERASVLCGVPAGDLVGRCLGETLVPEEDRADYHLRTARRLDEGQSDRREVQHVRPDGSGVWMDVWNVPLRDDAGRIVGTVSTLWELTERKRLEDQLRHEAGHDSLTGLPNRAHLLDGLTRALAAAARSGDCSRVAVMFIDLDDFKKINDSLGHAAGDRLLCEVAERLLNATRGSDSVARLGGDEFAVLLENLKEMQEAEIVAARVLASLRKPVDLDGTHVMVTSSIGIAQARPDDGPDELLRNADVAMYTAKQRGKETFAVFAHDMHQAALARLEVEADLRMALERDELRLFYQPIVDLRTGHAVGYEALLRWAHPRRGMVAPNDIIPIAETTGLIVGIGRWVLQEACCQAVAWQRERFLRDGVSQAVVMSVNVSARQMRDGPSLVDDVRSAIEMSGLPATQLQLEMTETLIMSDAASTLTTLTALSALGVQLAIDDFGTGYSSLSYLERFPVDVLKIDKAFVDRLATDGPGSPLPAAIVHLGRTLGLRVVAEGIETAAQAVALAALGCDFGQGFLFARPLPAAEIMELVSPLGGLAECDASSPTPAQVPAEV